MKTRRDFLKLLGKVAVVAGVTAAAPAVVLGAVKLKKLENPCLDPKLKPRERGKWLTDPMTGLHDYYPDEKISGGPITATEIQGRREEWGKSAGKAFSEEVDRHFLKAFRKSNPALIKGVK